MSDTSPPLPPPTADNIVTQVAPQALVPVLDPVSGLEYIRADAVFSASALMQVPVQPAGLTVSAITQTSLTLDFTPVAGVTYALDSSLAGQNAWTQLSVDATFPYTAEGLDPNIAYDFRLTPSNEAGAGAPEMLSAALTLPAQPADAKVSAVGQTGLTLVWTALPGISYAADTSPAGQNTWIPVGANVASPLAVSGLTAGASYDVRLMPCNASGNGLPEIVSDVTMLPAVRPPTGLAASNIIDTGLTLTWTASPDTAFTFLQQSADVGGIPAGWVTLSNGTSVVNPFTVTGLAAGTAYFFQVFAYKGSYSTVDRITVTTTGQAAGGGSGSGGSSGGGSSPPSPPPSEPVLAAPTPVAGALVTRGAYGGGVADVPAGAIYSAFNAFAKGAIPAGQVPLAMGVDASKQQVDNIVAWPDGSVRSAVTTWVHPRVIAAGSQDAIGFAAGAAPSVAGAATSVLTSHAYQLQVDTGGATATFDVNAAIVASRVKVVRSGAALTTFKVWGPFSSAGMIAKMWIGVAADGGVRFEHEIACNGPVASAAVPITAARLVDGATIIAQNATAFTLLTRNKFAIYDGDGLVPVVGGTDVSHVVWAQPRPIDGDTTTQGLIDALVVWPIEWSTDYIGAFPAPDPTAYAPNAATSALAAGVDGEGNHTYLGPLGSISTMAWLAGTYDRLREDRVLALAAWGRTLFWVPDPNSGYASVFTNKTYPGLSAPITNLAWGGAGENIPMTGGANSGSTGDASHAGLWWWWQYIATGSEQALENVQEQAVGVLGCNTPSSGNYQRNPIFVQGGPQFFGSYCHFPQPRAVGWENRNLSNAQWVCPDAHVMKSYLGDLVQVQYDSAAALMAAMAPTWGPLKAWYEVTQEGAGYAGGYSPWMGDYRVTSTLMDYMRGRFDANHAVMQHTLTYQYGRMIEGSFRNGAGAYRLGTGVGPNPPSNGAGVPTNPAVQWADVYGFADVPNITNPLVDPAHEDGGLRDMSSVAQMTADVTLPPDHTFVGHTYPNIAYCAAKCGVIAATRMGDPTGTLGTRAQKIVDYLRPLIENAPATESLWGSTSGAQAWRIRLG